MTHQYRQRVFVMVSARGEPANFTWRGLTYHVAAILAHWHLRDRWWESAPDSTDDAGAPRVASDRHYYRVCCHEGMLCELYVDVAAGAWMLDRVLD